MTQQSNINIKNSSTGNHRDILNKYKTTIIEFFESGLAGYIGTGTHILLSYFLDFYMHVNISTIIGGIVGLIIDMILNTLVFKVHMTRQVIIRFIIQTFICLIVLLGIFALLIKLIKKKKWWTNTALRIIANSITFTFIAFPMRKLWVFKTS